MARRLQILLPALALTMFATAFAFIAVVRRTLRA